MNSWLTHLDGRIRATVADLPGPANEFDLMALQQAAGRPLPPVLKEFLQWKPAGVQLTLSWETDGFGGGSLLEPLDMVGLMSDWKLPCPQGTVDWWNPEWVPLLDDGQDLLCLNLAGTFGHPAGSLLHFSPDSPHRPALFPHLEGLLRWLATALEQDCGRVFLQDGVLQVALSRKAQKIYQEFFPQYPLRGEPELLGLSRLDRMLNRLRKSGMSMTVPLPPPLTPDDLFSRLTGGLVREDGMDGEYLRVVTLVEPRNSPQAWTAFVNLREVGTSAVVEGCAVVPETVGFSLSNARTLLHQGDPAGAARRLAQVAFSLHQLGQSEAARGLLERAVQLDPEHSVARRSLEALVARGVQPPGPALRPLLHYLG
jgi:hypothetical protein